MKDMLRYPNERNDPGGDDFSTKNGYKDTEDKMIMMRIITISTS